MDDMPLFCFFLFVPFVIVAVSSGLLGKGVAAAATSAMESKADPCEEAEPTNIVVGDVTNSPLGGDMSYIGETELGYGLGGGAAVGLGKGCVYNAGIPGGYIPPGPGTTACNTGPTGEKLPILSKLLTPFNVGGSIICTLYAVAGIRGTCICGLTACCCSCTTGCPGGKPTCG